MAKETRKVHISVTSNASKNLNKGTVAAKGLSGSLKGVGAAANIATGGIKAMTMALLSSGVGVLVVGLGALVAGIGGVISKSAQYEKALSGLKAITGASSEDISRLSEEAKKLGSTTAFTASEVVSLQTELAKLGFKTDDISNSTGDVLNLAAALDVNLAEAAEFTGSLIRSFGLTTEETGRVVDVMARSTSSSALNFESLRESLKLVAPVSTSVGVSLEKTTALLGVLADRGLKGSIAGTGLAKSFIMLSKQGLTLEQGIKKVTDSGFDLNTAIDLVGIVGAKTFITLAKGADDIGKLEGVLNNASGAAKTLADERLNNLKGDITILQSAWEGFILAIEDGSGALNKLGRFLVQGVTKAIGFFQEQVEFTAVSWEHMMLGIDATKQRTLQAWSWFKSLGTNLADFALQAMEALADVPILGAGLDKDKLAAERVIMDKRLADDLAAIKKHKNAALELDKAQDKLEADYYKGKEEREQKRQVAALKKVNEVIAEEKKKILSEDEKKELEAKKAFLAKLKKLDEDTDDTTQLDKIQRKRERHLKDLKDIKMTTTERREAEKVINGIYDQMRDDQIDKNDEARKKKLQDFVKQFGVESIDPEQALNDRKAAHLAELELLKLEETEKKEAIKAINEFYANEQSVLDEQKSIDKAEQDRIEFETKRGLILDGLDLAIQASGEETKIGQALLKVKQGLALAEMVMNMQNYIQHMKLVAQEGINSTAVKAAEQSGSINVGFANAAKLGPPFNAVPLALMAVQAGMMLKNMAKSKKEMKQATAGLGGTGRGAGATAPQAPNFNVIGQTSAGDNLIADTIAGANNRPMRAFVVDKDITSSQELARNTENEASIG